MNRKLPYALATTATVLSVATGAVHPATAEPGEVNSGGMRMIAAVNSSNFVPAGDTALGVPFSHAAKASGDFSVTLETATPIRDGKVVAGYLVGCAVDVSNGIAVAIAPTVGLNAEVGPSLGEGFAIDPGLFIAAPPGVGVGTGAPSGVGGVGALSDIRREDEEVPPGAGRGDEHVPPGTRRGDEHVPPGTRRGEREVPPVEVLPPVEKPPVEKPPVEKPPVEKPPVEKPPVEKPPVETPPVEVPPVETPPVEVPPVEVPPVETPPLEVPPLEELPLEELPLEEPLGAGEGTGFEGFGVEGALTGELVVELAPGTVTATPIGEAELDEQSTFPYAFAHSNTPLHVNGCLSPASAMPFITVYASSPGGIVQTTGYGDAFTF